MAFVLMKIFEQTPRRFDRLMQALTFGKLQGIRDEVTERLVQPGARVLEIGCGSGALLEQLVTRGVDAVGIDSADGMVDTAREKLSAPELGGRADVRKLHALQVEDEFEAGSFDRVVSILAFSEMSEDEIDCLLPQCRLVLKHGGQLILVDEVVPAGWLRRLAYHLYRHAARLITYLGLQAMEVKSAGFLLKALYFLIELPLMLVAFVVAPSLTHPLMCIDERIEGAGFRILSTESFLGGSLKLFQAEAVS